MQAALRTIGLATTLVAINVVLLLFALRAPAPRSYDIGAVGDAYVAVNFYAPEQDRSTTFRWSGPDAALLIPDPYAAAAVISARLHGNPDRSPVSLYASDPSRRLLTIQPDVGWRTYAILAPRSTLWAASGGPAQVRLSGPSSDAQAGDPRNLGVALDTLRVSPIAATPGPLVPPLRRALLLTWAIVLVAAALWLAVRPVAPGWPGATGLLQRPEASPQTRFFVRFGRLRRPNLTKKYCGDGEAAPAPPPGGDVAAAQPGAKTRRAILGVPILLAAGVIAWARTDSASLGWALPLDPAGLSLATLLLAALWASPRILRRAPRLACSAPSLAVVAILASTHLLLLLPAGVELRGIAALVILGIPGALLSRLLLADVDDPLERIFFGLCGALALPILLLLALQALPAAIAPWPLLILCDAQSAFVGAALLRRAREAPPAQRPHHLYMPLALIMLVGVAFRLPSLGRAELHDDEATALVAAARMVQGAPNQLLIQLKGPAQVLLPAGPMALTGQINEWVARMPFLLAGMGVILGGYLLARRVLGGSAAWGALAVAAALAYDGFLIAFSRIVQYQSIVMIMVIGACWCCWRFYEGQGRPLHDLCAAAIMMAIALLSHYDAIYVAPALLWLVFAGGRRRGWRAGEWATLAAPVGLGAGLLASFYLPFVLHPHFSEALAHIGERTGQQGSSWAIYNNLRGSYELAIFYNTTPAVIAAVAGLALTLAAALVRAVRPRPLAWLLAGALLVAAADIVRGPGASLLMGQGALAALALGLPILALAVSPATPAALRAAVIWFGAACIAVSFLLDQPRTHMHVMDVPAALIVGYGIAAVGGSRRRAAALLRPALGAAAASLAIIAAPYAYALFVRQSPEYQRGFPMAVLPAYPALSGEVPAAPIGGSGRLGYPAQDGWKVIGELYRAGVLRGPFASNQSIEVSSWYTRGLTRCGEEPSYYIIAMSLRSPAIPIGYALFGIVQADGRNQLLIYSRPPATEAPQIFDSAQFLGPFDAQPLPQLPDPATICGQRSAT